MSVRAITDKLRAWDAGQPQPRYATIHHAVVPEDQALIVAFVRMAGESRLWGIAWGTVGSTPLISSVPDGRVRDDVAQLCASFAEDLLAHMRVHNWTFDPVDQTASPGALRQVWLPNGQHLAMFHHLSYTYSQTKFGGANQEILRALGRLSGWMFRDTSRRGHQHVIDASEALSDAYVFPAQDARTAHLGYQLAWLASADDRARRLDAATLAEGQTISPTMDPALERSELTDRVERWNELRRSGGDLVADADVITSVLRPELERRWRLTEQAYRLLQDDSRHVNPGVAGLVAEGHNEFWYQHQRIELRMNDPSQGPAFVAHPETDFHGSAAASRYLIYSAADEAYISQLIHDDAVLFQEAIDNGEALRGRVIGLSDLGSGRSTVPVWDIQLEPGIPKRVRENGRLVPYGSRGHEATVIEIVATPDDTVVRLEWTARKTKPLGCGVGAKPVDDVWLGKDVAFVVSDAADLTRRRSNRVWKAKDGPGAWLTHGAAPPPVAIEADDGGTDLLVDDITQIEGGSSA